MSAKRGRDEPGVTKKTEWLMSGNFSPTPPLAKGARRQKGKETRSK